MYSFDFHINPGKENNNIIKTFYFSPEDPKLKQLGTLYVVGEFVDAISKDKNFLKDLSEIIQNEYFSDYRRLPEIAFKESLKKANAYLQGLSDKGNVRWLGNLNIAVININGFNINFSKVGLVRLLLLRSEEYTDIAENLESQTNRSSTLKIFPNIVTGELFPEDKIIVFTQEISAFFEKFLAQDIIDVSPFNQKTLNKLIKLNKKNMAKFSGALFIIYANMPNKRKFFHIFPFGVLNFLKKIPKQIILIILFILILLTSYLIFKH